MSGFWEALGGEPEKRDETEAAETVDVAELSGADLIEPGELEQAETVDLDPGPSAPPASLPGAPAPDGPLYSDGAPRRHAVEPTSFDVPDFFADSDHGDEQLSSKIALERPGGRKKPFLVAGGLLIVFLIFISSLSGQQKQQDKTRTSTGSTNGPISSVRNSSRRGEAMIPANVADVELNADQLAQLRRLGKLKRETLVTEAQLKRAYAILKIVKNQVKKTDRANAYGVDMGTFSARLDDRVQGAWGKRLVMHTRIWPRRDDEIYVSYVRSVGWVLTAVGAGNKGYFVYALVRINKVSWHEELRWMREHPKEAKQQKAG